MEGKVDEWREVGWMEEEEERENTHIHKHG